jgi:hypothetical protein
VGWKYYRWRPWNSCNLLSLCLSLSLSQLSQLYIRKNFSQIAN